MYNAFKNTKAALAKYERLALDLSMELDDLSAEDAKESAEYALGIVQEAYMQDLGTCACAHCVGRMSLEDIKDAIR